MNVPVAALAERVPCSTGAAITMVDGVKVYGRGDSLVRALDGVTLGLPAGEWTAIMGPSGSGKSTLLHCLAGLDTLSTGNVYLRERSLGSLDDDSLTVLRRTRFGFVFQAFNLVPALSARDNVSLPFLLSGKRHDEHRVAEALARVGLADRADHHPHELSGGERQRVAIARALVHEPDVVFADEPTGNLDSMAGGAVLALFRQAVDDRGQTVVMVTHDPVAASAADSVVFLSDGRVVDHLCRPTAQALLERMKHLGA